MSVLDTHLIQVYNRHPTLYRGVGILFFTTHKLKKARRNTMTRIMLPVTRITTLLINLALLSGCLEKATSSTIDHCQHIRPFFGEGTTACSINENGKTKQVASCLKLLEDADTTDRCNAFCVRQDGVWEKIVEIKKNSQRENSFSATVLLNSRGFAIAGLLECMEMK
jgi:hypothetical protein